jgi:hypothetical protein
MEVHSIHRIRSAVLAAAVSIAVGAACLVVANPATAATADVALTPTTNASATVNVGDTVIFRNADAIPRQLLFGTSTGLSCGSAVILQPGSTQSCVATIPGVFNYSDPTKPTLLGGTITINPAAAGLPAVVPTVTLSPSGATVDFGDPTTLTGVVSPGTAGTVVDILAKALGESTFTTIGTATTLPGGGYSFTVMPTIGTEYRSEVRGASAGSAPVASATAPVQVRPKITLKKRFVKHGRAYLTAKALSSTSYKGKRIVVQRHKKGGGWKTLKTVRLNAVSSAKFTVRLPKGKSTIRAFMSAAQVGPGYTRATSNSVRAKRA